YPYFTPPPLFTSFFPYPTLFLSLFIPFPYTTLFRSLFVALTGVHHCIRIREPGPEHRRSPLSRLSGDCFGLWIGRWNTSWKSLEDRKSTRLNPVTVRSRMPSSA